MLSKMVVSLLGAYENVTACNVIDVINAFGRYVASA